MKKLFWGVFFTTLNFNLNFSAPGTHISINVLPDFVGFILLYMACGELLHESDLFQRPRPLCLAMSIYTALLWVLDLLGGSFDLGFITWLLSLAAVVVNVFIHLFIIDAIANTEVRRNAHLGSRTLRSVWKVQAVTAIAASAIAYWAPLVAVFCFLAAAIAAIVFLVYIHKTRKLYDQMIAFYGQ